MEYLYTVFFNFFTKQNTIIFRRQSFPGRTERKLSLLNISPSFISFEIYKDLLNILEFSHLGWLHDIPRESLALLVSSTRLFISDGFIEKEESTPPSFLSIVKCFSIT